MSYFSENELQSLDVQESSPAPGVSISRQGFLLGGASLLALFATGCRNKPKEISKHLKKKVSYAEALAAMEKHAKAFVLSTNRDEEQYITEMKEIMANIQHIPEKEMNDKQRIAFSRYESLPLVIMQIKMKPDSVLPLHDHRHYNGILLGMEGSCACRNFEFHNGYPSTAKGANFF